MARALSQDLRERVVGSVLGGKSCRKTASLYRVGVSTVVKWMRRHRETGNIIASAMGGDRRSKLTAHRDWLLERSDGEPDLTLEEHRAELRERGVIVGYGTVQRFFAREDYSFKKNGARDRAGKT